MDITSVEVIRHPGIAIQVGVAPGEKVELTYGDTLKVTTSFDYRGSAGKATLYGAIGSRGWTGFDEILHDEVSIALPESQADFTPCQRSVSIPITSDIKAGSDYDLYVKIKEYPDAGAPEVRDCIDIVGVRPEFELVRHVIYPQAYLWEGEVEVCAIEFAIPAPEQIPGVEWLAGKVADGFVNKVKEQGNTVLEFKFYEDKTPPFTTKFRAEVTAAVAPEEGVAIAPWLVAALAAIPWKVVWLAVITIIAIVILRWVIVSITRLFYKAPSLTDEVIEELPREDLVQMILYKAPKVEYEVTEEELQGMTDDGLRALLKELRDRQAPPVAVPWWPIAVGAGVVVLGVGIALATRKKE